MGRVERNKKRIRGLWQYRGLVAVFCLCFFCLPGNSSKNTSKQNSKRITFQAKNQKTAKKRTPASKKASHKPKKTAKKLSGYRVLHVKNSTFFRKVKLRKGDLVHSVNKQPVRSKKDFHKAVAKFSKKEKKFSLVVTRNKKKFLVSYKIQNSKKKNKILISRISQITPKGKGKFQRRKKHSRKIASVKQPKSIIKQKKHIEKPQKIKQAPLPQNKKPTENNKQKAKKEKRKRSLVPKKYKSHLQRAFVTSLNSFIYKRPNFDATQLYPLEVGEKILVSRKIFRPPHKFGSFYKIFLFHPKKIVGYISEAEVTTEFLNEAGKYVLNPKYEMAEQQMKEDKVLDIGLFEKKIRKKQTEKPAPKKKKKYYVGLSAGFSSLSTLQYQEHILFGSRLSGYGLLVSSLNMDFNFMASPYTPLLLHFDVSASYPLIASKNYLVYLLGGMKFNINQRIEDISRQNDFGLTGGASLAIPLTKRFLFRLDARAEYGFASQTISPLFLSSLQIAI